MPAVPEQTPKLIVTCDGNTVSTGNISISNYTFVTEQGVLKHYNRLDIGEKVLTADGIFTALTILPT